MTEELPTLLSDSVDYLMVLNREATRPDAAKRQLSVLQDHHPNTEISLLWEEETYNHSVHYDLLLHFAGNTTISVSTSADRGLPWPLRGVHHWKEAYLLRVNHSILKMDQAIACLDFIWDEARIINRLINACLIQAYLEEVPIDLSNAELQLAMDRFRRARKLYTVNTTYAWMDHHGMTHEQLETYIGNDALVAKLRDQISGGRVERYFEDHRDSFERAHIARIEFFEEEDARHIGEQIRAAEIDFYETAQNQFLAGGKGNTSSETFATIRRGQRAGEMEAAVFGAACGDIVGPFHLGNSYTVVRVLSFAPPRLNEYTCSEIKTILFEEWLEERRRTATIEWYWGDINRTSQVT